MRPLFLLLSSALFLAACDANDCEADYGDVRITQVTEGSGKAATSFDRATVAFEGFLEDGTRVLSDTAIFFLDLDNVITGFAEGVRGMQVGGQRRVTVPSGLAFGCQGTDAVPENSTLVFEMQMLGLDHVSITEVEAGTGESADLNDVAVVTYTGRLSDDTVFDSGSFQFRLGSQQLIPGFSAGVLGMRVGGKRQVVIPPVLGYGTKGTTGIPPNSTLIFDITLNTLSKN